MSVNATQNTVLDEIYSFSKNVIEEKPTLNEICDQFVSPAAPLDDKETIKGLEKKIEYLKPLLKNPETGNIIGRHILSLECVKSSCKNREFARNPSFNPSILKLFTVSSLIGFGIPLAIGLIDHYNSSPNGSYSRIPPFPPMEVLAIGAGITSLISVFSLIGKMQTHQIIGLVEEDLGKRDKIIIAPEGPPKPSDTKVSKIVDFVNYGLEKHVPKVTLRDIQVSNLKAIHEFKELPYTDPKKLFSDRIPHKISNEQTKALNQKIEQIPPERTEDKALKPLSEKNLEELKEGIQFGALGTVVCGTITVALGFFHQFGDLSYHERKDLETFIFGAGVITTACAAFTINHLYHYMMYSEPQNKKEVKTGLVSHQSAKFDGNMLFFTKNLASPQK